MQFKLIDTIDVTVTCDPSFSGAMALAATMTAAATLATVF
jgi:hypothetical protein